ncbi:MAG: enoyl-CoA hydratase/isomerase family protein [Proteobacteria bacterium]|nr:enoyl-CoA hydratase/isomerase family protein [Pseudomonadota bacterium]
MPPLHATQLLHAALDAPALSALTSVDAPWLEVELGPPAALSPPQRAAVIRWRDGQRRPVLGIAAAGIAHPLAFACDAVVTGDAALAALRGPIAAAPLAAQVLVQVLRLTEEMDIEHALLCESLAYATLQGGGEFRRWLGQTPARASAPQEGPAVLLQRTGSHLALCLNRPAQRNALSVQMRDALVEALELVSLDESIRSVSLSGAGACFSAGGDLGEFGSMQDTAEAHAIRTARPLAALLARCAGRLRVQVHGASVGAGVEMAAFARHVSASDDAWFQLPEIRYGLIPGSGGCVSIPRRIGRLRAGEMALSGRRVDAATALAWGLVDEVCAAQATATRVQT